MGKRLAKILIVIAVIVGLALLLMGVSMLVIPGWEGAPGGWLALLGAAMLTIAGLGGKIKDWVELLFGKDETTNADPPIAERKDTAAIAPIVQTPAEIDISQPINSVFGPVVGVQYGNTNYHPTIILPPREVSPADGAPPARSSPYFVERGQIMDDLRRALRQEGHRAIVGVAGMGGVGKTELAKYLAWEIERESPGRTIWVDVADRPLDTVLYHLSLSLGVVFPSDADIYLKRSILQHAFHAQPKVVFFDDVRSSFSNGLEFCLPPSPPCAALITTRWKQPRGLLLGEIHELDVMSEDQAITMLENQPNIGEAIRGEPHATQDLVHACARHPLALSLAARRLARWIKGRAQPIAAFVAQLQDRMAQLELGEGPLESLEANFDLSLQELQGTERQRYILLSAFAPSGFRLEMAASLWGEAHAPLDETRRLLERLEALSLLEPGETADRWKLHDLLHEFALKRLRLQGGETQAMERLCHLMTALFQQFDAADRTTAPHVAYELDNLRRAAEWALQQKDSERLARLATVPRNWLYNFFCNFDEWRVWLQEALSLGIQDQQLRANTLRAIGDVQQFRKEIDAALESYQQALALFRAVGARLGEANTLQAIGDVQQFRKEIDAALESYQQALALFRAVGDRLGEANTLKAIGQFYLTSDDQSEYERGAQFLLSALELYRRLQERAGQANILFFWSQWLARRGQVSQAIPFAEEAHQLGCQIDPDHPVTQTIGQWVAALHKFMEQSEGNSAIS